MYVEKFLTKRKYKKLLVKYQNISHNNPNRKMLLELILLFNTDIYFKYNPNLSNGIIINSRYPNIETLNNALKEINRLITNGEIISKDIDNVEIINKTIDLFLTTKDGFYCNPIKELIQFKDNVIEICELMEDSDTAEYGLANHNLRMLTKTFITLKEITTKFLELSFLL